MDSDLCVCGHTRGIHTIKCLVLQCDCALFLLKHAAEPTQCRICHEDAAKGCQVRNINLYVIGSEGLDICFSCESVLLDVVRGMMAVGGRAKLMGVKIGRRETK